MIALLPHEITANNQINSVINGDCLEVFPHIQDKSVDLILTDLPYGKTQATWDSVVSIEELWKHFERVAKDGAAFIFTAMQPFTTYLINSKPEWFRYELIWVKNKSTGHLNAKKMPMRSHENVLVFYKSLPKYNPQMTTGHEPLHYAVNEQTVLYGKFKSVESRTGATDRYPKSVLYFDVVNQTERTHETQKPVELFSYLIKTFSSPGDIVLDPCAGSGTTAISARNTGRKYILIEKNEKYTKSILNRLQIQQNIFE